MEINFKKVFIFFGLYLYLFFFITSIRPGVFFSWSFFCLFDTYKEIFKYPNFFDKSIF